MGDNNDKVVPEPTIINWMSVTEGSHTCHYGYDNPELIEWDRLIAESSNHVAPTIIKN